jgi:hypothetical protein
MATLDYTGAAAGAPPLHLFHDNFVCYKKRLKAADIIAADTTMTANGKISAGDIVQAIDVPAGFLQLGSAFYTVTPEGAAETADIGIAGGDEIQDGVSTNNTAGQVALTLVGDDWGPDNVTGYFFAANDTIDVTFVNDTDTGDWILFVWGVLLDLTT